MAEEAAVKFMLETLRQVIQERAELINKADEKVAALETDLVDFKYWLMRESATRNQYTTMGELNRLIRNMVYEIEDAIDNFAAQQASDVNKGKGIFGRWTKSIGVERFSVAQQVDNIARRVRQMRNSVPQQGQRPEEPWEQIIIEDPRGRRMRHMEGFQLEMRTIINYLEEETDELDVISLIGMPGAGKTTLAYNIFSDPSIVSLFDGNRSLLLWVNVWHQCSSKDVLLSMLRHFDRVTDTQGMNEDNISPLVKRHLQRLERFLIVMDDVSSAKVWTALEGAFPEAHKNGKILITTQNEHVASRSTRDPLRLPKLSTDESWNVLKSEALGSSVCPAELEPHGKEIAKKYGGIPLLMVIIGKFLSRKCTGRDTLGKKHEWEQVADSLSSCLSEEDFEGTSFYDKLPYHLRPCFLYAGMFPEGFEIPVRTLTRLWIAEGFVLGKTGVTLEKTAFDEYLMELINQNLVESVRKGQDGRIKTCRVHLMLREFCRMQAGVERENIFQEMKHLQGNVFEPSILGLQKRRRLSLDSNVNGFFSSNPNCPLVRSIMCFSEEELQPASISLIPQVVKFLRVLEAKLINFKQLPSAWNKLALLKYVVLSSDFKVIPEVISNLQNIQTLIVYTTSPILEIKANIWKMRQLRHVETDKPTKLPSLDKAKVDDNELQTLGMISSESCKKNTFERLRKLQKLCICGQLGTLAWAEGLDTLHKLVKLKLENSPTSSTSNQVFDTLLKLVKLKPENSPTSSTLNQLPSHLMFPPNLRNLTLCATNLGWGQMSKLKVLRKLEVLKLKKNAFRGDSWKEDVDGFSQLHALHIEDHDLKEWTAPVNPFPMLRRLTISNCTTLQEIPSSLAGSLEKLYLKVHDLNSPVADSARRIKETKNDLLLEIGLTEARSA